MSDFDFEAFSHKVKEYNLHSCVYCQKFIVDINRMDIDNSDISEEEVNAACDNGCSFLQECSRQADDTEDKSVRVKVGNDSNGKLVLDSYCQRPGMSMGIRIIGLEKDERGFDPKLAEVFDLDVGNSPRHEGDPPLAIHPRINDDACFRNIRNMLQECRNYHKGCQRTFIAAPPRRLIDVSHKMNDSVRLLDTESIKNPSWAALSYCWGEIEQSGRTTDDNINERRIQLGLGDLPLTIRDAIRVCRQLNIEYLWIDSICIIQDNATDKVAEIAKMTGIYQDAIITISASCASSANRGFLEVRTPYPPGVALPVRTGKGYAMAQLIHETCKIPPEPIDARAWTFQERILSTRFLSFTTNAVEWKCSQTYCNFDKHGRYSKPKAFDFSHSMYRKNRWKALIGGYSGRCLSYLKDRPVAFAGVAQAYCQANSLKPDDYLSGLWRQSLLKDLLWQFNPTNYFIYDLEIDLPPVGSSTEGPYIAPSWSWVSALYPVLWLTGNLVETAEVTSIQIELEQPDVPFGAVKSGSIRLRGRLHHDKHSIHWSGNVTRRYKHESDSHYHERKTISSWFNDPDEHVWFFEIGVLQGISNDEQRPIGEKDPFHEDPFHEEDFREEECSEEDWWEEDSSEEEHSRQHTNLYGKIAGLMLLSTGKENQFTRVGIYEEDRGGIFDDNFFDESCKWCALNMERKLTEIEIV